MMSFPIFPSINNIILQRYVTCLNSFASVRLKLFKFFWITFLFAVKSAFIKVYFAYVNILNEEKFVTLYTFIWNSFLQHIFYVSFYFLYSVCLFVCLLLHFHSYNESHILHFAGKNSCNTIDVQFFNNNLFWFRKSTS